MARQKKECLCYLRMSDFWMPILLSCLMESIPTNDSRQVAQTYLAMPSALLNSQIYLPETWQLPFSICLTRFLIQSRCCTDLLLLNITRAPSLIGLHICISSTSFHQRFCPSLIYIDIKRMNRQPEHSSHYVFTWKSQYTNETNTYPLFLTPAVKRKQQMTAQL